MQLKQMARWTPVQLKQMVHWAEARHRCQWLVRRLCTFSSFSCAWSSVAWLGLHLPSCCQRMSPPVVLSFVSCQGQSGGVVERAG